jgi:hypothetical protein
MHTRAALGPHRVVAEPATKAASPRIAGNLSRAGTDDERVRIGSRGRHESVQVIWIMLPIAVDGEGMREAAPTGRGKPGQECGGLAPILEEA